MVSRGQTFEVRFLGDVEDVLRATRSMNRELGNTEDAQNRVARSSERMGGSWRDTFAALDRAKVPILGINAALGAMAAGAIKFASDLGEAQSAVEVTFGESQQVIDAFAATSAKAYGVSKRAANEYAASLGAIFTTSGLTQEASADLSVQMIQLAADLGSLRGLGVDEALEKIRSGLVGEAEPLRTVGSLLNETRVQAKAAELGFGTLASELTEGEKVQARAALIMQDLSIATGNYGDTLGESLPNQAKGAQASFEDLAAALGESLLPAAITATEGLSDLIGAFAALPEPVQLAVLGFTAFTVGSAGVLALLPGLVTGIALVRTEVLALNLALAANPAVLAVVAAGAVAAGAAWLTYSTLSEAASQANTTFSHTAEQAAASLNADVIRAQIFEYENLRDAIEKDIAASTASADVKKDLEKNVADLNEEIWNLRQALGETTPTVEELGLAEAATRGPTEVLAGAMDAGAVSANRYAAELSNLTAKALAAQLALQTTADGTPEEMDARFEDAVARVRRQLARDASTQREIDTILQAADPTGYWESERQQARPGLGQVLPSSSRSSGGGGGSGSAGMTAEEERNLALEEAYRIDAERKLALTAKEMAEAEIAATEAIKARTEAERQALDIQRSLMDFWRSQVGTSIVRDLGVSEFQRLNAEIAGSIRGNAAPPSAGVDVVVP